MDYDLAEAVFLRWNEGLPVYEGSLYKAAEALGVDPQAALLEARYYTHLDSMLTKVAKAEAGASWQPFTRDEMRYVMGAAGGDEELVKVAGAYDVLPLDLALQTLQSRGWQPDLEKLAFMMASDQGATEGPPQDGGMAGQNPAASVPEQGDPLAPQPGAQLQQQPAMRERPSPTAPPQIPPGAGGNIDAILAEAAQMDQQAQQGGQGPGGAPGGGQDAMGGPGEMPSAPPQPDPADKLLGVAPNLDPSVIDRYSQALQQLEQQVGMPVQDPKQLTKFIQQMQKADGKIIDEAIKDMADQQQQQMASPQLGAPKMPPSASANAAAGKAAPPPAASAPGAQQAMAKVAGLARMVAQARRR